MSTETAGDGRQGAGGQADARDDAGAEPTAGAEPGTAESGATRTSADDEPARQQGEPSGDAFYPDHRELDTGPLRGLIRDSGLSVDAFLKLL